MAGKNHIQLIIKKYTKFQQRWVEIKNRGAQIPSI